MSKKPCTHEALISTEYGKAMICRDCGIVYWHFMNMSMRFDVTGFLGMADTLAEAAHNVRVGDNKTKQSPVLSLVNPSQRLN
ncbi:MAG: hypothetical protein Q7U57_05890 [Methylovulum sp.]|nr:hypothetical protein [Methylovulum sp.]